MSKSIRPSNRVRANNGISGRVLRTSRRKQGGAWVRVLHIKFDHTGAVRKVNTRFVDGVDF